MPPVEDSPSHYAAAVRRSRLGRAAAISAVALFPLAACGDDDAQVFSASSVAASTTAAAPVSMPTSRAASTAVPVTAPGSAAATTAPKATAAPAATTAPTASTATAAPAGGSASGTFPAGGQLVVDFTFAVGQPGRQIRNPYVAVWVEDQAGNLIQTISLWYQQGKGQKWLSDLRSWYSASNGRVPVTTGATRAPGSFSVAWNGAGADGKPVPAGNYVLFVEAAREHGPYEITSAPITIGPAGFTIPLTDKGELTKLSATLKV
ncbi:MAG: DUF2271 domain-containing protein [Acidimicrobiales bacterium]